jgi:phage terminase Nu1 subunit (DNA packaging protein)
VLEVNVRRGSLLDADAVAREWADVLRRVRAGVLAATSRIRARLVRLSATDAEVIDRELRDALAILADDLADDADAR